MLTDPPITTPAEAATAALAFDPPVVLKILPCPRGGWRLLPHPPLVHPEDLIGFTAPTGWEGVATVNHGRVALGDGHVGDAVVAAVTVRSGAGSLALLTWDGLLRTQCDEPVAGHVADAHRRVLGLPSAPEPSEPSELLIRVWLDDLVSLVIELGDEVPLDDWASIDELRPRITGDLPAWADLHRNLVETGQGWGAFDPAQIAWMDAPMWARHVLATRPPVAVSLAFLEQVMPRRTFRKLTRCLPGRLSDLR